MRVEPHGDAIRVTFEWPAEGERVALAGGPAGWRFGDNLLERESDGVWRRSYVLPRAIRASYGFLPDLPDELEFPVTLWSAIRPDPLNPATFVFPGDPEDPGFEEDAVRSVLEGPDAAPNAYAAERSDVPRGTLRMERLDGRRVWLYLPPGHDPDAAPYPLLLVFDGWAYVHTIRAPTILDNLLAEGTIPPLAAVLVDSPDRVRDLCYGDAFVAFLADELLPWARREGNATDDPRRTIAAGSSAGGLAAAFVAYRRPDLVANVLSQSGAFWWGHEGEEAHEWLTDRLAEAPPDARFSLEAGLLENEQPLIATGAPSLLDANRRVRDVLGDRVVRYAEFAGGHDYLCWQATFADGLRALAG
jgi:enterochelin esterase family protein